MRISKLNAVPSRRPQLSLILISISVLSTLSTVTIGTARNPQEGNDAVAYNAKGLELFGSGKYEDAVKSYKQAINLKADYADAHYNLGDAYFQLTQYKKAIEAYKQAIRYRPESARTQNNIGTAYYKLGDRKKAIQAYKEAIRLD